MLKVVGSVMLLLGCVGAGFLRVRNMDKRIEMIRSLLYALETMERELSFRVPLLEDMLSTVANSSNEMIRNFFSACKKEMNENTEKLFVEIWVQAAKKWLIYLKNRDLDTIFVLGRVLGRYDCDEQRRAILQTHNLLEQSLRDAEEERSGQGKVYKVLGAAAGALLIILLL